MNKDTKEAFEFNTVEEALQDLKKGKIILCTDDPDRENEEISYARENLQLPKT